MGKTILVNYGGAADPALDDILRRAQQVLSDSASNGGIDEVFSWDRRRLLATSFYAQNRRIFDYERGGGYWLWKPYIIGEALRAAGDDDVVVYRDVGRVAPNRFTRSILPLIRWCRQHDGLLPGIPILPQHQWTKRDCFVQMQCDSPKFWNARQIQATFSVWCGKRAIAFVSEWLQWCVNSSCLTDEPNICGLPNLPGFRQHRHDQSILTNLCVKYDIAVPASPPIPAGPWSKNANLWAELFESLPSWPSMEFQPSDPVVVETICRAILKHEPDHPFALRLLGAIYLRTNRHQKAVEAFRRAVEILPHRADYRRSLQRAIRVAADSNTPHSTHVQVSKPADAADLSPSDRDGDWLSENKHRAIRANSHDDMLSAQAVAERLNGRGLGFGMMHEPAKAEQCFRAALQLDPDSAVVHGNLANTLVKQGKCDQAVDQYRRALALKPDAHLIHSNLLLAFNYQPRADESLIAEHMDWAHCHAARLYPSEIHWPQDEVANRRLRIGYVSADFRRHPVAFFISPILRGHRRDLFEVFCYSDTSPADDMTGTLRDAADQWRDITRFPDDCVAKTIRDDRIDILVDLAGHMGRHRLLVFARRAAPVQVTYLGYPNTTGLATMDYRITDAEADPPGMTESHYTEKLIRLPDGFLCYEPPAESPPVRENHSGHRAVTFGSFNNFAKINVEVLSLWAKILRAVPGSRLLLKADGLADPQIQANTRVVFSKLGVDGSRIEMLGFVGSAQEHLAKYHQIDIALDTFPYNGTTTTCEAMWMGVPVITLAGKSHRSRVGASLLRRVELTDLVAQSRQDYAAIAIALAQDRCRLNQFASGLRQRMRESPLMNATAIRAGLERALIKVAG